MGSLRSSSNLSLLQMLCTKLVSKIDTLQEKELVELLTITYPYIGFGELRPIVLQVMRRCQHIPIQLLQSLNEQLRMLQIKAPVQVMQQLWKFSDKAFIEAITPLIRAYILQSASAWSVRAAQVLHKTRMDDAEQATVRHASAVPLSSEELAGTFKPFDMIPPSDLDLRQSFLSISDVPISNPSEQTLRIIQFESENLGPSRNAFSSFLEASSPSKSLAEAFSNLLSTIVSSEDTQLKLGTPLNSYSAASNRDLNLPLQLLADYVGDHLQLYSSVIRYIRRLMMEIQSFQLKLRPGIEFERQFPLLSSLGVLSLFTIYKPSLTSDTTVPAAVDPMLSQILGSLRFDVLMVQHDRTRTAICEQDELHRFAWCMDAIRREASVKQRHYEEMEGIFTSLQTHLDPLKRQPSSSPASKAAKVTKAEPQTDDGKRQSRATTVTKTKTVPSKPTAPTKKKSASKSHLPTTTTIVKTPDLYDDVGPISRRQRGAAARKAIRAAMSAENDDFDDESDEEKKVFTRARPKRKGPSTMDLDATDSSDDDESAKPRRKKAKRSASDSEDEYRDDEEDFKDDGAKVVEGDEYVDLSEDSVEDEFAEDDAEEEIQEDDFDGEDYEYGGKPKKKITKKKAKAAGKKATGAKKASGSVNESKPKAGAATVASSSGLKLTLTGLTGTGGLVSHAARKNTNAASTTSAPVSMVPIATGIKLKRGDQVLVDTAAALTGVADPRGAASLISIVTANELESNLNFLSECGWILSSGSMQMTLQTILFTILKETSQQFTKPPSPAQCDPANDIDTIKKIIISDKRISRLMTLLQLGCLNFPILHATEGLDNPVMIALLAERILESKVVANLLSPSLSAISTKPWTRNNVEPNSLNTYDRHINLLSAIVLMSAYTERYAARNVTKEAIRTGDDEKIMELEERRLETMLARSQRHQQASGDLIPDIRRAFLQALSGADESEQADMDGDDYQEPKLDFLPPSFHPDASLSLTLFWALTQIGSANENVANAISHWVTEQSAFWAAKDSPFWALHSYPTFIQELLFGFARADPSSPVLSLRYTMVNSMLATTAESSDSPAPVSILRSRNGLLQLLAYLYLALTHNSISKQDARQLHSLIQEQIQSSHAPSSVVRSVFDDFTNAILPSIEEHFEEPVYDAYE